CMQSLDFPFTF
nr:immunoglobulin light chain junction region [Macaca mulatta]MOX98753.1 immunoglobulin light chain junction region [Macaca mulatta]MOY01204.1 immunoglobulin light chain junction region [Macaca mulatta]